MLQIFVHRPEFVVVGNVLRMGGFGDAGDIGVTALVVAQMRALESERGDGLFSDPYAQMFVSASGVDAVAGLTFEVVEGIPMVRNVYEAIACRTRYLDDVVMATCEQGCRQVVVLAAGLDMRACRLPVDPGVTFYEVDLSTMLAFKDEVLERNAVSAVGGRVSVVADLTQDWQSKLMGAGFDPTAPTLWIAEGIMMYFTQGENDALLEGISRLSARGSHFVFVANGPGWLAGKESHELKATVEYAGFGFKSHVEDPWAWLAPTGWAPHNVDTLEDFGARFGRRSRIDGDDGGSGAVRSWAVDAVLG